MRGLSAGMLTMLGQEVTTLATCWKVTRKDGNIYFFTDYSGDIVFGGDTYKASTGMNASAVASSSDMSVDNLEASGAITSATITDADIIAGKWDYAAIEIFQVDWTAPDANGKIILRTGTLGQLESHRNFFKTELRGLFQPFSQPFGRDVNPACDTDLGSSVCTINLTSWTHTSTVTSSANNYTFVSSGLAGYAPSGGTFPFFVGGKVTFNTGANASVVREVKSYTQASGTFTFFERVPYAIAPGDSVTAVTGCDKSSTACNGKFNNIINFQGFNLLPGLDALTRGPFS